jgi:hypothetical protein
LQPGDFHSAGDLLPKNRTKVTSGTDGLSGSLFLCQTEGESSAAGAAQPAWAGNKPSGDFDLDAPKPFGGNPSDD